MILRLLIVLLFSLGGLSLSLADQRPVIVGARPNDGTGDTLRDALVKLNANDAELYGRISAAQAASNAFTTASIAASAGTLTTAFNTGLALKAPLASPTFTGAPTVPTPTANDNSARAASTAYVDGALTGKLGRQAANVTMTVPSVFSTPQAGVDACSILAVDRTATCTVQIAAGTYTSGALSARSPYGDRIVVQGAAPVATAISAVTSVTGSDGAYSVTYTVGSTAGIAVGQYVAITGTSGDPAAAVHGGGWLVTAINSATSLTVASTVYHGAPPAGAISGALTLYPTQIKTPGASGVIAASLGGISNVALIGDGTAGTFGLWAKDATATQPGAVVAGPMLVVGYVGNVRANYGGQIHGTGIVSSSATNNGFEARDRGGITCASCVSTGNGTAAPAGGGNGALSQNASAMFLTAPSAWGNAGDGLFSRSSSSLLVDTSAPASLGRNTNGARSAYSAFLQAEGSASLYNTTYGWLAENDATLIATSATATGNLINGAVSRFGAFLSASGMTATGNAANNFYAGSGGRLDASGAITSGAGNVSFYEDVDGTITSTGATGTLTAISRNSGRVLQSVSATPYTTNENLSVVIPFDDTIPQATEGTQVLTLTITPTSATSKVRLRFRGEGSKSAAGALIGAIFRSGQSDAIRAGYVLIASSNATGELTLEVDDTPATTSPVTYAVRVGGDSGSVRMNGNSAGRLLGGAAGATLTAEEIKR